MNFEADSLVKKRRGINNSNKSLETEVNNGYYYLSMENHSLLDVVRATGLWWRFVLLTQGKFVVYKYLRSVRG